MSHHWKDPLPPDRHLLPDPVAPRIALMLACAALVLAAAVVGLDSLFRR